MEVTELTKKIHDEYPKVWDKIRQYLWNNDCRISDYDFYAYDFFSNNFPMLYGLFDKFFREHDIFLYKIFYEIKENDEWLYKSYQSSYEQLQQVTILKACEIMEEQLCIDQDF
jgi:hypothetical protein